MHPKSVVVVVVVGIKRCAGWLVQHVQSGMERVAIGLVMRSLQQLGTSQTVRRLPLDAENCSNLRKVQFILHQHTIRHTHIAYSTNTYCGKESTAAAPVESNRQLLISFALRSTYLLHFEQFSQTSALLLLNRSCGLYML